MAKEFKEWDKKFSKSEIEEYRNSSRYFNWGETSHDRWIHGAEKNNWTHDFIRECVYESHDAYKWQKFRVALKGLSTREKLKALEGYWTVNVIMGLEPEVNQCRVDNYIGALVRGGQLTTDLWINDAAGIKAKKLTTETYKGILA